MLEELLYKLLVDYTINKKYIDLEYLNTFKEILICFDEYKGYIDNISTESIDDIKYSYSYSKKTINVSLDSKGNLNKSNLELEKKLLHEALHASQYKICNEDNVSLKSKLLHASLDPFIDLAQCESIYNNDYSEYIKNIDKYNSILSYCKLREKMYNDLYICMPSERMAQIDSIKMLINIINKSNSKELKRYIPLFEYKLLFSYLIGYQKVKSSIICPTFNMYDSIFNIIKDEEIYEETIVDLLKESSALSLEERMYYGLPISNSEYKDKCLELTRSKLNHLFY